MSKFRDTAMFIPLAGGHNGMLNNLVDSRGDKFGPSIKVRAQMLVSKYLRYGVKRDFLILIKLRIQNTDNIIYLIEGK